ncbi:MAG TPA: tetraacyldisaccharide 4'-kinase, partial [Bacteroidota bacterium]
MKSLRLALLPFSFLFWLGTLVRNWLFDIGLLHTTKLDVPVISVGNISAGGTGKTPFVGVVVQKLKARRKNPAVVSRGYGRTTSGYLLVSDGKGSIAGVREAGDEPVQLAEDLRNTAVVV